MNSMLSRVKRGIVARPQRVVLYGVESVGKTTLAAKAPNPIILDVEGGSSHLDVPRLDVSAWADLEAVVKELAAGGHDFRTVVVDSMDWAEKLAVEDMLARDKKGSLEDYGYGKGYTMAAERMARFLASMDRLIEAGMNVCLIAHAKVVRHEPPDGLQAYDRFELKMTRQTSPLVKEWSDSLLFANFRTRVIESGSGKAKGIGGKERIILTQRSAAHDAKCRVPGVPEEIPMTWEAVSAVFGTTTQVKAATEPMNVAANVETSGKAPLVGYAINIPADVLLGFLRDRGVIEADQGIEDVAEDYVARVAKNPELFRKALINWQNMQKETA